MRTKHWFLRPSTTAGTAFIALLSIACTSEVGAPGGMAPPTGSNGTATDGSGTATGTGGGATNGVGNSTTTGGVDSTSTTTAGGGGPGACVGDQVGAAKRMVRLSFHQITNSIGALLGQPFAETLASEFDIGDLTTRTFPPLANLNEGSVVTDIQWQKNDKMAERSAEYLADNYATLTGCADVNDAACGQAFLQDFASRAYRRPLMDTEWTRLNQVFTDVQGRGSNAQTAVQYGVYAVLQSPQFLYRTEFGGDSSVAGALTPAELASQLSYFIADAAPDEQLRAAAANGQLATPDGVATEAMRLLATDQAKANLQAAVLAYFGLPGMFSVVIDPAVAPDFNPGLGNAMFRESELFLNYTLWTGIVDDLMVSKQTFLNDELAALYGVTIPPTATRDADGFAQVQVPAERSGLLTQPGFLTARSRPNTPSVVGRGLLVNATLLCVQNPAFPTDLADTVDEISRSLEGETERAKADYRATTVPCGSCHRGFDPYGLVLDNFDIIGKYRTVDPEGRPIDASVTLPAEAGGAMVADAAGLANELVVSGVFARCMARNMIGYALAEGQVAMNSCSVQAVVDAFNQTDKTFTSLVREVAVSQTLAQRTAGAAGGSL